MLFKSTFFSILQNGTARNSSALVFDTNVFKGFRSTDVSHGCTDWESIIGVPAFCQTWFEWHFNTTSTFGDTGADESHLNSCWIGEVPLNSIVEATTSGKIQWFEKIQGISLPFGAFTSILHQLINQLPTTHLGTTPDEPRPGLWCLLLAGPLPTEAKS